MARYQAVDIATGRKLNIIEWDGTSPLAWPADQRVEPDNGLPVFAAAVVPDEISDRQSTRSR